MLPLSFLGYILVHRELRMDPAKVMAVRVAWSSYNVSLDLPIKSYHIFSIGLRSGPRLGHTKTFKCFPLNHSGCFSSMLRVIILLEGEPPSQSQISGRLKQVSLKNVPVFSATNHSFNSDQFPSPCRWKTSPHHDAATTMLHCWDAVLRVMRDVGFVPDIAFSLVAKKLTFSLIWSEYLLPNVWGVSHMPFGDHQTCLLIFFWTLFCKAQLCG